MATIRKPKVCFGLIVDEHIRPSSFYLLSDTKIYKCYHQQDRSKLIKLRKMATMYFQSSHL